MLLSILGGISIGIAAVLFLLAPNPLAGALLFGIGLINIRLQGYALFTGKVQTLITDTETAPASLITFLLLILAFNLVGIFIVAFIVTICLPEVAALAVAAGTTKLALPIIQIFVQAMICGYLMTIATRSSTPLWMTLICVFGFVSCGLNHCIADAFYYFISSGPGAFLPHLGMTVLGNTIGGVVAAITPPQPRRGQPQGTH